MLARRRRASARVTLLTSVIAAAMLASSAVEAQSVYPYSATEDKAAQDLEAGLIEAKTKHLAAIDAHKAFLETAIQRERQLVLDHVLAIRDRRILTVIDKPVSERAAALRKEIDQRVQALAGLNSTDNSAVLDRLSTNLADAASTSAKLEGIRAALQRQIRLYEVTGPKLDPYCSAEGVDSDALKSANDDRLDGIRTSCRRIRDNLKHLSTIEQSAGVGIAALLGRQEAYSKLPSGSPMRAALEDAASTAVLLDAQKKFAKAAKDRLVALKAYHKCQQEAELRGGGNSAKVKAAAAAVDSFVTMLSNWEAENPADLMPRREPATVEGNNDECLGQQPSQDFLTLAGVNGDTVARLRLALVATQDFRPLRSIIAAAEEAAQDFKASRLETILSAIADPASVDSDSREAVLTASFLQLYADVERMDAARRGKLPDTSAVLVRLAGAQMRQASAQLEAERLKKVGELAEQRAAAFSRELISLLRARERLAGATPNFDRALLEYSESWTSGRAAQEVLYRDMLGLSYTTWIARERAVVEAAYGVLEPAVAELKIYGAQGVKASEVAGYLQTLGLGAIAW